MTIEKPRDTAPLRRLWQTVFSDTDAFLDVFFRIAFSPERCLCVFDGGMPVSALYWFDVTNGTQKLAYLYGGATHPAYRRRGLYGALLREIMARLKADGYAGAVLVPSRDDLFAYYEKAGFSCFGGQDRFSCDASDTPASLRAVSPEEYARLRRGMLPRGGIVQEGAMLKVQFSYASFYAGEDFILCAAQDGTELTVYELLGNAEAAPGIVAALGATRGYFRTPGASRFAMFAPLCKDAQIPSYFGLALD